MVLARFLPRDERFFDSFQDAARNAEEMARLLLSVVERQGEVERAVRRLRDLEHRGDEITHHVFNALNRTFVTPLDRSDIHDLTSALDDFADAIEEVARRLQLYRIGECPELARQLARIIVEQAEAVAKAVPLLERVGQHAEEIFRHNVEIHRLENEADDVLSQALATLYDGATDVPSLIAAIRWGELYGLLEDATDNAEHIGNTLEGIVLKHA